MQFSAVAAPSCAASAPRILFWSAGHAGFRDRFDWGMELLCSSTSARIMGKYSETIMDHVLSPRNGGVIENPDLTGDSGTPGRGAFLILFLRVEEGRISAAKYHTVGCGPTIACGSVFSELVLGRRSRSAAN
jgi:hypothetical protein